MGTLPGMPLSPALQKLTAEDNHLIVRWRDPGVAEVILANPGQRNAMSQQMTAAWSVAMAELAHLDQLRVVVVKAQGSAFCAGGRLDWIAATDSLPVMQDKMRVFYRQWLSVWDLPVPTVAYLHGPAVGAGAAIALACDIRWAGPQARLSVPFTRLGLHPGMGTTYLLQHAGGPALAADLLFTGRWLDAPELLSTGLVSAVVDEAQADADVDSIAVAAPIATRLTKQALRPGPPRSLADALAWETLAQPVTMTTDDLAEGLSAAAEKRPPRFTGR